MWASQICDYGGKPRWCRRLRARPGRELGPWPRLRFHCTDGPCFTGRLVASTFPEADTFAQLFPALLALSLLNRGHAKIKRQDPPAELNRRRKKREEPRLLSYWSIEKKEGASS